MPDMYRYFPSKDALLDAVADMAMQVPDFADSDAPWDVALHRLLVAVYRNLHAMPKVAQLMAIRSVTGPGVDDLRESPTYGGARDSGVHDVRGRPCSEISRIRPVGDDNWVGDVTSRSWLVGRPTERSMENKGVERRFTKLMVIASLR